MASTTRGWWIVVGVGLVCAPSPASGQESDRMRPVELGLAAGVFVDYPRPFVDRGCLYEASALTAEARFWTHRIVAVETSMTVTGEVPGRDCAVADLAAPIPIGVPVRRTVYPESIAGHGFFATTLGIVLEPFRGSPLSPRARLAAGRMWDKELGFWLAAAGMRYQFGRHALVMDVERWKTSIDARLETVVYDGSGGVEVQASEPLSSEYTPYLVRVGWSVGVR